MSQPMFGTSPAVRPFPSPAHKSLVSVASIGLTAAVLAAAVASPVSAAARKPQHQPLATSIPASPANLSDHEIEELASMRPQQQAERLVERAVNHYAGALELIAKYVDTWYGQLNLQGRLSGSLNTAMNSNDLRVRGAALDIYLAGNNLPKRSETAETLIRQIQDDPASRPWALFMLGALGNRGIETQRAFTTLMDHRHDPDEQTRFWDPSLDATTRGWVIQSLRDITGTFIGPDPAAWRTWWAQHGQS
jgi:hypothetical protein